MSHESNESIGEKSESEQDAERSLDKPSTEEKPVEKDAAAEDGSESKEASEPETEAPSNWAQRYQVKYDRWIDHMKTRYSKYLTLTRGAWISLLILAALFVLFAVLRSNAAMGIIGFIIAIFVDMFGKDVLYGVDDQQGANNQQDQQDGAVSEGDE